MPLRVDGPDRISKAERRAIARVTKKKHFGSKGNVSTYTGKPKGDPVFGFVKKAASAIGGLPDAVADELKETYKGVKTTIKIGSGSQPRASAVGPGRKVNTRNVRAATAMAAEMTNLPAMQRLAEGKATKSDIALLALAAAPGVNALGKVPSMTAFGITAGHANKIIKEGEAVVKTRKGQRAGLEELEDMFEGLHPAIAKQIPGINRLYNQDVGYPWRKPFLTSKKSGRITAGGFGETHGGLLRSKHPQGVNPEIAGRYRQGMISRPDSSALGSMRSGVERQDLGEIKLDLGYGRIWGKPSPENEAFTHKFLMHLLRNYPDELVQIGKPGPRMRTGGKQGGYSPSRDEIFEQYVRDVEAPYKPHTYFDMEDFARTEKMRKRRGRSPGEGGQQRNKFASPGEPEMFQVRTGQLWPGAKIRSRDYGEVEFLGHETNQFGQWGIRVKAKNPNAGQRRIDHNGVPRKEPDEIETWLPRDKDDADTVFNTRKGR